MEDIKEVFVDSCDTFSFVESEIRGLPGETLVYQMGWGEFTQDVAEAIRKVRSGSYEEDTIYGILGEDKYKLFLSGQLELEDTKKLRDTYAEQFGYRVAYLLECLEAEKC